MPQYHFHLDNGTLVTGDVDGRDLADDATAIREGGSAAGEFLKDELLRHRSKPRVVVTIERRDGASVAVIRAQAEVETF